MFKKIYVLIALLVGFNGSYGMEKELPKPEYVEDARQLSQEHGLYFNLLPKDILGIVQYYRLAELAELKIAQAQDYNQVLDYIKALAAGECAELFNNHKFINSLLEKISSKFGADPEEVAGDINTLGTSLWRTHIRPDQIKLLQAAESGNLATVQQLIAQGVSVNARNRAGETALMWAATWGHAKIVSMLIEAGANVNARDRHGLTALIRAAAQGHIEVVKELIGAGADVNAQNVDGRTALRLAACNGHTQIVQLLIAAGAGVAMLDDYIKTALDYARQQNNKDIIKLLERAPKKS